MAWVNGYIPRWYACPKTVTHPSTGESRHPRFMNDFALDGVWDDKYFHVENPVEAWHKREGVSRDTIQEVPDDVCYRSARTAACPAVHGTTTSDPWSSTGTRVHLTD